MPSTVTMRQLLEAGVHFGHQTRRWNPKMRRFIHGERGGIYLIDLIKTKRLLDEAYEFAVAVGRRRGTILFVGTKKPAQDAVREEAERAGQPFVSHRWLGGLLTNWQTVATRTGRLHELRTQAESGQLGLLPSREQIKARGELEKLEINLGGVAGMSKLPDAIMVIDLKKEELAVREAARLHIPIIGLVDTNCDPDQCAFVVPGNDDAMRSNRLIAQTIAQGLIDGRSGDGTPAAEDAVGESAAEETAAEAPPTEAAAPDEVPALAADHTSAAMAPTPGPEPLEPSEVPGAPTTEEPRTDHPHAHDPAVAPPPPAEAAEPAERPEPDADAERLAPASPEQGT